MPHLLLDKEGNTFSFEALTFSCLTVAESVVLQVTWRKSPFSRTYWPFWLPTQLQICLVDHTGPRKIIYRQHSLAKQGDNALGSVRPSITCTWLWFFYGHFSMESVPDPLCADHMSSPSFVTFRNTSLVVPVSNTCQAPVKPHYAKNR